MPIFEYICETCGTKFEELVRSADEQVTCPQCGKKQVEKLYSPFARFCGGCEHASGPT
jgi:putative FmdB family regulatory protein